MALRNSATDSFDSVLRSGALSSREEVGRPLADADRCGPCRQGGDNRGGGAYHAAIDGREEIGFHGGCGLGAEEGIEARELRGASPAQGWEIS